MLERSIDEITKVLQQQQETKGKVDTVVENEDQTPSKPTQQKPAVSPTEEKARTQGWRPQDEWDGEPDEWVDAHQFIVRGELMDRIKDQGRLLKRNAREVDELRRALRQLGEVNTKMAKVEREKVLKELKRQKMSAVREGDDERVVELDDKIEEVKATQPTPTKEQEPDTSTQQIMEPPQEFLDWAEQNQWYNKDIVLNGAANALGFQYKERNPDADLSEVLEFVTEKIKEEFPHKFKNQRKRVVTNIETDVEEDTSPRRRGKSGYSKKDLSPEQLAFGQTFVDTGAFKNIQEYVDQLSELGELPAQQKGK